MEIITYETIRKIQRDERESQVLQKLPDNFFAAVRRWLEHKQKSKDTPSLLETENAKKLIEDIINRRVRKIVIAALHTLRGNMPPEHMLLEEQKFFDSTLSLLKQFRQDMQEQISGYDAIAEEKINDAKKSIENIYSEVKKDTKAENNQNSKGMKLVKILTELPRIVGKDLQHYGPFNAGQTAELPTATAEILIMRGAAESL